MNTGAEAFGLRYLPWDWFVTLTFPKSLQDRPLVCRRVLFAWLRSAAECARLPFYLFPWAVRSEYGGIGGLFHYHALLAGFANRKVNVQWSLHNLWKCHARSEAVVDVRAYDDSLPGVDYICDGLSDLGGRSVYELGRFGKVGDVMLSRRALELLGGRAARRRSWLRHGRYRRNSSEYCGGAQASGHVIQQQVRRGMAPSLVPATTVQTGVNAEIG